ncbi:hypothetical protein ACP70R_006666 [Stipagrostis hirtigluma subsp. patula]
MESEVGNGGSRRQVVTELAQIKELVSQLDVNLGASSALCKHLTAQIFSLTERSIAIISSSNLDGGRKRATAVPSPLEDVADMPFKNNKKRKTMEKKKHVRVSSVVDDGHSWRKYGQKDILGTKYPRGYYRCTHRRSTGCLATKQVQRADDDPTLFDVIYLGEHTCVHNTAAAAAAVAQAKPTPEHNPKAHSLRQSWSAKMTVETQVLAVAAAGQASGCLEQEQSPFSTPGNWGVSPATSDSNQVVSFAPFGATAGDAEQRARSEFQEVVSALVAASSAPEPDFVDEFLNLDPSLFSYHPDP